LLFNSFDTRQRKDVTAVAIERTVPNIRSDRPAQTRDFFTELLGFDVAMDLEWVVTLASPTNPSAQVTIIGNDDPAAPGISVELVQVERARTPRGPVELGPVTAFVFADENDNALGASQLRHAARCLGAAADEVDRLTPAIDLPPLKP
jgi:catechol 2,3-dioxygenase-like lactoylglutathione lyase family enzyme